MLFFIGFAFLGRSYEFIYILLLFLWIISLKRKITHNFLYLLLLGCVFTIFSLINYNESPLTVVLKSLTYWAFYMIGLLISEENEKNGVSLDSQIYNFLFSFACGCWLRYVIDVAMSWSKIMNHHRWITDLWTKTETTATIGAGWCVPLACIFYYVLVSKGVKKIHKIIVCIQLLLAILFNILTGTRTFLVIFILTTFLAYILHGVKGKKDKKSVVKVTCLILAVCVVCSFLYANNIFGIRDIIQSSTLLMRLSNGELSSSALDSNGRVERIIYAINNIDKIYFGGSYCANTGYRIHNWVFQCMDLYGVIAAIILLIVIVRMIRLYFTYIRSIRTTMNVKIITFSALTVFLLYGMIEPVLTSNNIVISVFFAIGGILDNKRRGI